jgi:hypothetical protein
MGNQIDSGDLPTIKPGTTITRIFIDRARITARGASYEARLDSPFGPILVGLSPEPMFAACRALVAMGRSGPVEVYDAKRPFPRMSGDIATLAKLTVDESRRGFWRNFGRSRNRTI